MTITFRVEENAPVDLLAETEILFRETAEELVRAIKRLKARPGVDAKAAIQAIKDIKTALQMVMDERTRVEKLRRQAAGAVGDHALDFDAARDEIGRRVACLRNAGGGG
jgi:hypothetical protein